jgi:ribosomal protein L11 methyltransferase
MPPLWAATVTTEAAHIDVFADVLGENALAVSTLAPPRQKTATAEAIFGEAPNTAALTSQLAVVAMLNGIKAPTVTVRSLPQLDWLKKVATDFPPLPLGKWLIHSASAKNLPTYPRHHLQIDATSAFGTGEHPTTRGCLLMLGAMLKKRTPKNMLDMGCGTGVLAMAYAQATRGKALGVDMDDVSVVIARDNARLNGLQKNTRMIFGHGYRPHAVKKNAPYDLIMANIFAKPLAQMAKDAKRTLKRGGRVILAGLLNTQANMVIAAYHAQGIYLERRMVLGEWTILALRRRP